jgi:UDP-N-acetylmuramyl tripeptide synthase
VLDVVAAALDEGCLTAWQARVGRAAAHLGWSERGAVYRTHRGGTLLAIAAPYDQLFLATEVNEWALCATLIERDPTRWADLEGALIAAAQRAAEDSAGSENSVTLRAAPLPVIAEAAARARFEVLAAREAMPALRVLLDAAAERGLPYVLDESLLTLGAGTGAASFPLAALPAVADVAWQPLHDIPTALVTGSNGKTTTVRLLAACARAHGWHAAYNCTDGVFLDDEQLASGDYSGPAGTRRVMREPRAQAAVLETARGGILRRGIAVSRAHAAVITNVSADHFGEYGIDDLGGVADAKFVVAAVVAATGLLVLNADDPELCARADDMARRYGRSPPLGWFSVSPDHASLDAHRARGASTCGMTAGHLRLHHRGIDHDLGAVAALPLSMGGSALYNVANMAAAALAAVALGIAPDTIAAVLARFGSKREDNPGRMMRFDMGGVTVLVDYAHNAAGLRGFLKVAARLRSNGGRLGLLLGQAGNRRDADIEQLAHVVTEFAPDLVIIKENETQLRGRAPGEVPRILHAALAKLGLPPASLPLAGSEIEAARRALEWATPGDVLALPVHSSSARSAVIAMLENREQPRR